MSTWRWARYLKTAGIPAAKLVRRHFQARATTSRALMFRIHPVIPRNTWRVNTVARQWNQTRLAAKAAAATPKGGRVGKEKYWSDEKLSISHKYPLSLAVAKVIHPDKEVKTRMKKTRNEKKAVTTGGIHVRTQIVSPDLCGTSSPECFFIEAN